MRATAKRLERLEQQVYDLKLELTEMRHMRLPGLVKDYVDTVVKEKLRGVMIKRDAEQIVAAVRDKLDGKLDDVFNNASEEIIEELSKKENE